MKKIALFLILAMLLSSFAVFADSEVFYMSEKTGEAWAKFAKTPPVIDGVANEGEWDAPVVLRCDSPKQAQYHKSWTGKEDLSADFSFMWDKDYLYMIAYVTDNIFCQNQEPGKIWAGDSIQIGVYDDKNNLIKEGKAGARFEEIALAYSNNTPIVYRFLTTADTTKTGQLTEGDFALECNLDGNVLTYEFKISWKDLFGYDYEPSFDSNLGFSALVNDDDGNGRVGWIEYAGGIGMLKNVNDFVRLIFYDDSTELKTQEWKAAMTELSVASERCIGLKIDSSFAFVNGNRTQIDSQNSAVTPVIRDDRTLVPLRFVSEAFGAQVDWDEVSQTASVILGEDKILIPIGSNIIYKNNNEIKIDVEAFTLNDRTMIPLRAVSELLGKNVYWDEREIVLITQADDVLDDTKAGELSTVALSAINGDAETIKSTWLASLIESGEQQDDGYLSKISNEALELSNRVVTDGSSIWSDISWTQSADMTTAYNNISKMALGYGTPGTSTYKDENLKSKILYCLEWMYQNRYGEKEKSNTGWRSPGDFNWWDWNIGSPLSLMDTMLIMEEHLTKEQISKYLSLYHTLVPVPYDEGSNRVNHIKLIMSAAALEGDYYSMISCTNELNAMFDFVDDGKSKGLGYYSDGTYIFHGKHVMNGLYGLEFYKVSLQMLQRTENTQISLSEESKQFIKDRFHDSYMPFVSFGSFSRMARGRGTDTRSAGSDVVKMALTYLDVFGDSDEVKAFIKANMGSYTDEEKLEYFTSSEISAIDRILAEGESASPEISRMYSFGDKAIHKKTDYSFALSMSSSRIYNYESINNENLTGWYTGDGMTNIITKENTLPVEYWNTYNPYFVPGTTVDTQQREAVSISESEAYLSSEDFVGGATLDDKYLVAAMCLESYHNETEGKAENIGYGGSAPAHNCSLKAKKSWFAFDDEIICLGADIDANDGFEVMTVLENTPQEIIKINENSFYADGIAEYRMLDGKKIEFKKDTYTAAFVSHGKNPSDESYAYAIIPVISGKELKSEVLSNTDKIQAVCYGDILAVVFYEAGEIEGIKADAPCIVITDGNKLSVSDPARKYESISLVVNGNSYTASCKDGKSTEITLK